MLIAVRMILNKSTSSIEKIYITTVVLNHCICPSLGIAPLEFREGGLQAYEISPLLARHVTGLSAIRGQYT
jgi:hypothetical protein